MPLPFFKTIIAILFLASVFGSIGYISWKTSRLESQTLETSQATNVGNGEDGKNGEDGTKGEKGDQGLQGETGLQGEKGAPGKNGEDGDDGDDANVNTQSIIDQVEDSIISLLSGIFDFTADLTGLESLTIGGYTFPTSDGNANQVLKTNGSGSLTWQDDNAALATTVTTVGVTGSGADYIVDGVSDDVQIQAAINEVTDAGGGVVRILPGVYDIRTMITVPKDPKIRIEGEYVTKSGYGGTTLKASSTLSTKLEAIIKESGDAIADSSNSDHSHASHYSRIVFDGNSKAVVGLLLLNTDHTIISESKFVGVEIGIDGQFNGNVSLADYAGGMRVESSSFMASNINIRLDSHTQDWITDSWFLGTPNTHIHFISSNKIHLSNNEFNTVSGQTFVFDDSESLHCGDINITGGFINAGSGKNFWQDNRTNSSSKGVIVAGVRFVLGNKTMLFNQAKEYQAATYTNADLSGGVVTPNYADEVVLLNGTNAAIPLQLPPASTAINNIWVKAINITNTVSILPDGSDQIERNGTLGSSFVFSEVNESVLLSPDGTRWRVLSNHKPTSSGSSAESVVEISSSPYVLGTTTDVLLVNAFSSAITVTLPSKSSKSSANKKSIVIKVINATNAVTINAAGSDQIDNSGQTSVSINDTRTVTFIANTGSRWRTYTSSGPGGSSGQIQFNNSGGFGASNNLYWDNANSSLGIGTTAPKSKVEVSGTLGLKRRAVSASTNSGDEAVIGVTSTASPRTITLRTADTQIGRRYTIKDESGGAGANNITVDTEGAQKIDGQDTYVINGNYGFVTVYSDGSNWFIENKQ